MASEISRSPGVASEISKSPGVVSDDTSARRVEVRLRDGRSRKR